MRRMQCHAMSSETCSVACNHSGPNRSEQQNARLLYSPNYPPFIHTVRKVNVVCTLGVPPLHPVDS